MLSTRPWLIFILLSVFTTGTFAIAVMTPPLSGPFCLEGCYEYPFHDIADRFPRDYYWMYAAIFLFLIYIPAVVVIHHHTNHEKKVNSTSGLIFAVAGALVLIADYFVQLSVVQPSLLNTETEGIAMLSQYNPHGYFIVLEELGYLLLSVSFIFFAFVFSPEYKPEKAIRIVFLTGFFISILALLLVSFKYGLHREYYYEVAAISIVWLVFIINGILLSVYYKRKLLVESVH